MSDGIVTVNIQNMDKIAEAFRQAPAKMTANLSTAIERSVYKVESEAKKEAPVNKSYGGGNLRQSIRAGMINALKGQVAVGVSYGIFVHEGTRPHEIRVINKRVLANKRTEQIFGTRVHHPGTKANPFLQRAADNCEDFINKEFKNAVKDALS